MNAITVAPESPLTNIGRRLRAMGDEMERIEMMGLLHSPAYNQLDDEYERLHIEAMATEPVSLRDAVVLALCVAKDVGYLVGFDVPMKDARPFHERIEFANSSILSALVKAGIRFDDIGPYDAEYEIARHRREPGTYPIDDCLAASSPDAALIWACNEWQETLVERLKLDDEAAEAKIEQLLSKLDEIADQILKAKAQTPMGVRAKAHVVEALVQRHRGFAVDDYVIYLIGSITDDLREQTATERAGA